MSEWLFDWEPSLWSTIIRAIKEDRKHYRQDMALLYGEELAAAKIRLEDWDFDTFLFADLLFEAYRAYFQGELYPPRLDPALRVKLLRVRKRGIEMEEPRFPAPAAEEIKP